MYPSDRVFFVGIMSILLTSQLWCDLGMIFASYNLLGPVLALTSWSYLLGFVFYLCLFISFLVDEVEDGFRTVFTCAIIGTLHLYGFAVARIGLASVAEIKNQTVQKKTLINEII